MTKHTPGPWRIGTASGYNPSSIQTENEEQTICSVFKIPLHCHIDDVGNHKETQIGMANARLICAAPELLEALKSHFNGTCYCDFPKGGFTHHGRHCELTMTAIAKAEGRSA